MQPKSRNIELTVSRIRKKKKKTKPENNNNNKYEEGDKEINAHSLFAYCGFIVSGTRQV